MDSAKQAVKSVIPPSVVKWIKSRPYRSGKPKDVFSTIYQRGVWGKADTFDSGAGSRDPEQYRNYVEALTRFMASLAEKPDVVDLGCGDFHIGNQIRPFANRYIAGDVVELLVERNKAKFADLDVDFRVIDMTADELPPGDIVTIKQVLQHLSNDLVAKVVAKLPQFKYAIITEHVPAGDFVPNLDHRTGPDIRMERGSGLDLEKPPFSLKTISSREIASAEAEGGIIRTMLYQLR